MVNIEKNAGETTITFEDGITYIYNDNAIYRDKVKIATNVTVFDAEKKTIIINNVEKEIVSIKIEIGNSAETVFSKSIDYTLKYW